MEFDEDAVVASCIVHSCDWPGDYCSGRCFCGYELLAHHKMSVTEQFLRLHMAMMGGVAKHFADHCYGEKL